VVVISVNSAGPPRFKENPDWGNSVGLVMNQAHLDRLRWLIESQYLSHPTGCGSSFGELLCWEIHTNGMTFVCLAEKWGLSLPTLGELIWDHCKRLEKEPSVNHHYVIR
jgi:hypothetical protein